MTCLLRAAPVVAAFLLAPAAAGAQSAPARTAWGAPDLQGVWNHGTATPLERPERHAGRERLTAAEIAEVNAAQRSAEGVGARRVVWWERGLSDGRTSMIVDPPDGRMPLTPAAAAELRARPPAGAAGPEDRNLGERCISSGVPLPFWASFSATRNFSLPSFSVSSIVATVNVAEELPTGMDTVPVSAV